jgi:hypothetical protein
MAARIVDVIRVERAGHRESEDGKGSEGEDASSN